MISRISTIIVAALVFSSPVSLAQGLYSKGDSTVWRILVDVGLFPAANRVGVGWYPSYSGRAGIGYGTEVFSTYLFVDYYSFGLSEPGGLHEYLDKNASRRDLAIYPAVWIYRIFFVGAGVFSTHSDHVRITSIYGIDPWSGGDVDGLRLFGTIGLSWDISVSTNISVPVGVYYRTPGYNAGTILLGIRIGLNVKIR